MAQDYTFSGVVLKGHLKLSLHALKALNAVLKGWRDCPVTITVERRHATRSSQANRYYWGVVVATLSEHTGYTPEEMHESLKQLFLPKRLAMLGVNGAVDRDLVIGGSTTKLNVVEFYEYCERIREWAGTTLQVAIPTPEQEAA